MRRYERMDCRCKRLPIEVLTCGPDGEPKWIETASESLPERRAHQPDNEVERHTSRFSPVKAEKYV